MHGAGLPIRMHSNWSTAQCKRIDWILVHVEVGHLSIRSCPVESSHAIHDNSNHVLWAPFMQGA